MSGIIWTNHLHLKRHSFISKAFSRVFFLALNCLIIYNLRVILVIIPQYFTFLFKIGLKANYLQLVDIILIILENVFFVN